MTERPPSSDDPPETEADAPEARAVLAAHPEVRTVPPDPHLHRHRPVLPRVWFGLRAVVLICLIPLVFALLTPFLLIGQEISAPSWLKARVEAQAASALGGGSLTFGDITVEVARDLHPTVRMTGTEIRDAEGRTLARIPVIATRISPRGIMFRREVLPQEISLSGAQVSLTRGADGTVAVSFNTGGATMQQAANLPALLGSLDAILDQPALAALERITADGLILNYDDARAGRAWTVDGGQVALDFTGGRTRLDSDLVLLSRRDFVTTLALSFESPRGSPEAQLSVRADDVLATDIATQSPALSWLGVLEARLSAELDAELLPDGSLGPFRAELDIRDGALRPDPRTEPVKFQSARAVLDFDPATGRIGFETVEVQSDWGAARGEGQAFLQREASDWPSALVAQFSLSDIVLDPPGFYPQPLTLAGASTDFRLRLDPFAVDLGRLMIETGPGPDAVPAARLAGSGRVTVDEGGWRVALDGRADQLDVAQLLALWPEEIKPGTRRWLANNVSRGTATDIAAGIRLSQGGGGADIALTHEFRDADVRVMRSLPMVRDAMGVVAIQNNALTVTVHEGRMAAPQGGEAEVAGSIFRIPDTRIPQPTPARLDLRARSTVTAALSLLDSEPFRFISRAGREVTLAQGRVSVEAGFDLILKRREPGGPLERVPFVANAVLTDLRSDRIVPGRTIAADRLALRADTDGLAIGGPMRIGQVPASLEWRTLFGPANGGRSEVSGRIELSERFIDEFGIALPPDLVRGSGEGGIDIALARGAPPAFRLTSDLRGLRMSIPALNWSKGADTGGAFEVSGRLGPVPQIEVLTLDAPGLDARGSLSLRDAGGLDRATFSRVRVDGWLDGPVTLVGRGAARPPEIRIGGGTFDLRRAQLGGGAGGAGGPMRIALDRLQVTDGIALTGFQGDFTTNGGFQGEFVASVNGGAPVQGVVAPMSGGTGVRIQSNDAGAVLRAANLFETARSGALDMSLTPTGQEGQFDGVLDIDNLRIRDAPALASLIDAISVVGLLQQLDGQGLLFTEVDANFRVSPSQIAILQSSAVGPGLGISLDGYYTPADRRMDFQGVLSPLYLINGVGSVLTRPGEGLFGFSYRLTGPVGEHRVDVNPLSVLTPGMFREIFRRPPPEATQ
ncbi:DUF3971 domain-containing protein [Ponticoccus sp. SC2-23]|uniref:DUF3971 domain-containing protein n=1 Tax=Alexandriicola marinus TaxID=2081710 RepID=UPI000FD9304E|nr:DUF3971 domain-containing protein [Alexandriicola marinus]MBM1219299.1 DUF3971 domain-containing protein [Ponticoccus sp. SC6-9]MBM1223629.1 DUF3971 domain-containing protein [Ponticoccus sp. SC6-15]MBM1229112.1 DUF3971 domain-containing protein [Ponticoccus sp. SC6-38]MBM1232595.1 DUF3971 domain-containing protein [Ponticoccus sp. SC6-45]MBM1237455.1 DUF3971 domain-containing protein [Ponticoccus sp. SC6-49]MBM1241606.1 DUF3971 domain-containing protein [Ponticoccus sp. SC2-64]MBM1246119